MKVKLIIELDVTEKRLLKLGFKKKTFTWKDNPKDVYVIGRHMNDCGSFEDTVTYDPVEKQIDAQYGGNFPNLNHTKVESMYGIKEFLKTHSYPDDEVEHVKYFGEEGNGFQVCLINPGVARIGVMKILRDELKVELKDAKHIVNVTPSIIKSECCKEEAEKLKNLLEDIGAIVELK